MKNTFKNIETIEWALPPWLGIDEIMTSHYITLKDNAIYLICGTFSRLNPEEYEVTCYKLTDYIIHPNTFCKDNVIEVEIDIEFLMILYNKHNVMVDDFF